ncbi:MAG: MBL fold metallo-hydrolase [Tannerella sp.]|jgi:glyoxylase-like metal-dependent hydrolase (beta-lactamase superfamily II)|nr:MBL fold metallo-hydrolase [Tannerella sp.]
MKFLALFSLMILTAAEAVAQDAARVVTFAVGDFRVSTLSEGGGDGQASMLKGATPEMLQKYLPDGTFPLGVHAFLVRTPDRNILIDTGYGRHLFDNLQSLDVSTDDIDVILMTHLHGDHIGGLLRDGKAAFPNAELYLAQAEYDYWMNADRADGARAALAAYKDKMHTFVPVAAGRESTALMPGIHAVEAYGHTPGHTAFLINSKWLIWGDVTHAMPIQIPCPEVALAFDSDSDQAIRTRRAILEYVVANRITVAGMHIPFPAAGNIAAGKETAYVFTPLCLCEGI